MRLQLCCRFPIVPAQWRFKQAGTPIFWLYGCISSFLSLRGLLDMFYLEHTPVRMTLFPLTVIALISIWLIDRSASKPRLYEAVEVVWWCVLGILINVDVVLVEDTVVSQLSRLINAVFCSLVPALLGIRTWNYLLIVSWMVAADVVTQWFVVSDQGLSRNEIKELHRLGVVADLTWSLHSPFETTAKFMAEKCLQPLQQRPSIKEIFSFLTTWRKRIRSGSEAKERWRTFARMDAAGESTSSDDEEAEERRPSHPVEAADTPSADPGGRLAL
eukprot:TRINITY_DN14518_c1_g4_i1.p1 TRINITY_DN14518_c1_g4~~TRINITY_DN14518_c1_g4_i1.p1  ORF type:complete len:273 (-),score=11.86 TRINITY_DN14518_c1_g4_i1:79-897(-)